MTAIFEAMGLFDDRLDLALTRGHGWISPPAVMGWYLQSDRFEMLCSGGGCLGPVKCHYCLAHRVSQRLSLGKREGGRKRAN